MDETLADDSGRISGVHGLFERRSFLNARKCDLSILESMRRKRPDQRDTFTICALYGIIVYREAPVVNSPGNSLPNTAALPRRRALVLAHSRRQVSACTANQTPKDQDADSRYLRIAFGPERASRARHPLQHRLRRAPCTSGQVCPSYLPRTAQVGLVLERANRLRAGQATRRLNENARLEPGAFAIQVSLRAFTNRKKGGRSTTGHYMSFAAPRIKGFSPYSVEIETAITLLRRLAECPVAATTNEQEFMDRLMAAALRYLAQGMQRLGCGGSQQDHAGLAICARQIDYLAERTTAPIACELAANEIAKLKGTMGPLDIIQAAALALEGARQ